MFDRLWLCGFGRFGFHDLRRRFGNLGDRSELLAKQRRLAIIHRIGMRCHRHSHVLEFADDLGVVEIQFACQVVNSKLWRHSWSSILLFRSRSFSPLFGLNFLSVVFFSRHFCRCTLGLNFRRLRLGFSHR